MKKFRAYISENVQKHLNHFVDYACSHLDIEHPPHINIVDDKAESAKNKSFGNYNPSEKHINLNIAGRHTADVLRTLAHELVHHKQNVLGELHPESGETGSDHENEANSMAGVIMRNYGKANPAIFESKKVGHIFDMDGTIYKTTAKVRVRDKHTGEVVHHLSHDEYNKHVHNKELQPHQHYDFDEFRSSRRFNKEKPIQNTLRKLKNDQHKKDSKVYINTARPTFDNKHMFLRKLRRDGIDTNKVHVDRAGNDLSPISVAQKKAKIISKRIRQNKMKAVHFYDDDKNNLNAFLNLKKTHHGVKFHAWHVGHDGSINKYDGEK